MIRNTANVSFYCRESKKNKDGVAPIEMSLIINGKRCIVQLPRKEAPAAFKRAINSKRGNDTKDYLEAVRRRINEIETSLIREGLALTADNLKSYFRNGGYQIYTVRDLFDDYMSILIKRVGKDLTPKTYRKYEISRDKFYATISPSEPASAITRAVILDYQATLNRTLDYVTTNGYCQKIKTVVQFGIDNNRIKVNPFCNIHLRKGEKCVQFLTEEEVALIRDFDFHNESLNRVRDLFVFQAASGLSYSDMAKLVPEDFKQTKEGQYYIHDKRNKTGVYYTAVILEDGVHILKKYDFKLPVITNHKVNVYLKTIRDLCGIEKPIFSHVARHTYATRCLNRGIRLEVVAKLLGHSTPKITQHYAKLLDKSILSEVDEAFKKA
ncbi:MAG: integrase catalytic domain-containing protein [Bacteroidales bacterium]|nr:integrase catalytic domain-containing protein [Bacteroidales bacterium]